MQNKIPNVARLLDVARAASENASEEQEIIDTMNSKAAKEALKLTGWYDYLNINRAYYQARYGKYALMGTLFAATGLYVGSLLLAPTLFPLGLAAITTVWLKWTLAAVIGSAAAYTGFNFLKSSVNEMLGLFNRAMNTITDKKTGRTLSNHDITLLATVAVAGAGLLGLMYLYPALLPVVSNLGTWSKLGVAAGATVGSASTGYAAYKGFFNSKRNDDRGVRVAFHRDDIPATEEADYGVSSELRDHDTNPFIISPKMK